MLCVLLGAFVMGLIGLGSVARYAYIVVGMGCALHYILRSPWDYITITFWFWTLTPLARRLIDDHAGFDATAPLLATPNLMAIFMIKDVFTDRRMLHRPEAVGGLVILASTIYGIIVNMVQGDVFPALVASADWILPLLYFFYFLCHAKRIDNAESALKEFVSINALVMFVYGLWQFLSPFPWDAAWMIGSELTSIGQPVPYGLRVFGTLNSPGIEALWLSSLLLLLLHFRTKFAAVLAPLGVLVLLLTSVRVALGSVVVGLLIAAVFGRRDVLKFLTVGIIATAVIIFGVAALDPAITDIVAARVATIGELNNDTSALERTELYKRSPAEINDNPLGLGIAAVGRTARAVHSPHENLDSGPITIYLTLGWVAGSTYLLGLLLLVGQSLIAARRGQSSASLAMAVTAIGGVAILPFANVSGFLGVVLYTSAAYAVAAGIPAQDKLREFKRYQIGKSLTEKEVE